MCLVEAVNADFMDGYGDEMTVRVQAWCQHVAEVGERRCLFES
jgi:hypothetical protein